MYGLVCLHKLKLDDASLASHGNNDARRFYHHFVAVDPKEVYAISVEDRLTGCGIDMSGQLDAF